MFKIVIKKGGGEGQVKNVDTVLETEIESSHKLKGNSTKVSLYSLLLS